MVEGARLESVYTRKGIAGSNPALSANKMDVPGSAGAFLFGAARSSLLDPEAENKNGSSRSERTSILFDAPATGSAQPIPPSPQVVYLVFLKEPVDVVLTGFLLVWAFRSLLRFVPFSLVFQCVIRESSPFAGK